MQGHFPAASRDVVIVCRGMGQGGSVAAVALRHAEALALSRRVFIVSDSPPPHGVPGTEFVAAPSRSFRSLHRFAHVPAEWSFASSAAKAVRRIVRSGRIGIVLTHSHLVTTRLRTLLHGRGDPRLGMVIHGDVFDRPPGTYDAGLTALYRWATPRACRQADLVIALSLPSAELAAAHGAPQERIQVIPNGISPVEIGAPDPSPKILGDRLRLVFVGRLAVEKGVDVLIRALGELREAGVELSATLVGDGPRRAELEALAKLCRAQVTFSGAVPRDRLGIVYAGADVICIPSRSEGFCLVVIESLACGTPVIGSAVGGIPAIVEHGVNGLLVSPGSVAELRDAIRILACDPQLLTSMSQAARPSVLPRFSWETIGKRLVAVVDGVIGA